MNAPDVDTLRFNHDGLVTAIVRNASDGTVLTLAWMNRDSYAKTLESGETWFWSRSRKELWHKGATSGNTQQVVAIQADCDGDALLVDVLPQGPACHTGAVSCFDVRASSEGAQTGKSVPHGGEAKTQVLVPHEAGKSLPHGGGLDLEPLVELLKGRKRELPEGSYSTYLFREGVDKILKKVGEEATEVVIAAKGQTKERLVEEISDLFFHLSVLMVEKGVELADVAEELERRKR